MRLDPPAKISYCDAAATPAARIILDVLGASLLEGKCVERETKRALRAGTSSGALASNELRSAASTLTYGVVSLRGRLQHLLPADDAAPPRARHACLAAAYLLHERRGRATRSIGPESLGLDGRTLRALRTADVRLLGGLDVAARHSLPAPLVDAWSAQLPPAEVEALAATCNVPGPVTLRANVARTSATALSAALRRRGFACAADGALSPWAVAVRGGRADWPCSLWSLNEWQDGSFEVQDEGSQFVALATEAARGERVLDLCAGNGGKSVAIAGMVGDLGHVFAYDVEVKRLEQLRAAAVRAGVGEHVTALGSAAAVTSHAPYDVVLVDAPCSSSGTIRRHPGLRWAWQEGSDAGLDEVGRWRSTAAADFPALQRSLCAQALSLARPNGGRVVYATCSLEREQNDDVADAVEAAGGMRPWEFARPPAGAVGAAAHRVTLWPHRHGCDGFFVARWRRG